jgi:hypothetical protein
MLTDRQGASVGDFVSTVIGIRLFGYSVIWLFGIIEK